MIADLDRPDAGWLANIHRKLSAFCTGEVYESIIQWLEANYFNPKSDRSKHYDRTIAPWFTPILESIESGQYNFISVLGAIGTGKSELITQALAWSIGLCPGDTLLVGQTDQDAADYCESRLYPVLQSIAALKDILPANDDNKRRLALIIPGLMNLYMAGGNVNSLQSKSVRRVFVDEAWLLASGMLTYAIGRTHNRKDGLVLVAGQAGIVSDEHWHFHQKTQRNVWSWTCPQCSRVHTWDFKQQVVYEVARTQTNALDRQAIKESCAIDCPHCHTKFQEQDRKHLIGSYTPVPSNALDNAIGFKVSALGIPHVQLHDIVIRHEEAVDRLRLGDNSEIKSWKQQVACDWWEEDLTKPGPLPTTDTYSLNDYSDGVAKITDEVTRFMSCDFQLLKRYVLVRAIDNSGNSKLIGIGELDNNDEVVRVQQHFNVPPSNVFLDLGYDSYNVGLLAHQHGYRCLRGSSTESWRRTIDSGVTYHGPGQMITTHEDKVVHEFVSPETTMELRGQHIPYKFFSSYHMKDVLFKLLNGGQWETPRDVPYAWHQHLQAERKIMRYTANSEPRPFFERLNKDNHYLDCEAQIIAALVEAKIL